jgi:hypothetical protein
MTEEDERLGVRIRASLITNGLWATDVQGEQAVKAITTFIKQEIVKTAKAYGGCTNCYGKGYATYSSAHIAADTDQDIGSPGGHINIPFEEIRFCLCSRGRQLKKVMNNGAR